MIIIVIPILIAVLLGVEELLYRKYWDKNLGVSLQFDEAPVTEGDKTTLTEVVTNGKRMPVPVLEVGFSIDRGLYIENAGNTVVSDLTNAVEVFSVGGNEKVTRRLSVDCRKRGYYIIQKTSIVSHDMLSLTTGYANLRQYTHLYVYPRRISRSMLEIPMEKIMGELSTRRYLYENIFLLRGVRDYVPTDPENTVNWKATAKTGSLKVNLHDHSAGQNVTILLNLEDPTIWYNDRILEDSISLTAGIAGELTAQGIPVGVVTNAHDRMSAADRNYIHYGERKGGGKAVASSLFGEGAAIDGKNGDGQSSKPVESEKIPDTSGDCLAIGEGASADHLRAINELLSRVDLTRKRVPFAEIVRDELRDERRSDNSTYVLISSSRRKETAAAAEEIGKRKGKLLWICILTKDMKDEPVPGHVDFVRVDRE